MSKFPIIFYDSECSLCSRFRQGVQLIDRDQIFHFISIHSPEAEDYAKEYPLEDRFDSIHLIDENQNVLKGSDAITYMANKLPGIQKFSWLLESDIGKKTTDFFYQKVNELRVKSQEEEDCGHCSKKHKK